MAHEDPTTTPTIPPAFRTWLYVVGTFSGTLAVALGDATPLTSRVLTAVSVAACGVAFGYRPTR